MSTDDREEELKAFGRELEKGLEEAEAQEQRQLEDQEAPYGGCWQNPFVACTPVCNAFIREDVDEQGRVRQGGDRCEILVLQRVQATALLQISQKLGRKAPPSATDGPPPPKRPGEHS